MKAGDIVFTYRGSFFTEMIRVVTSRKNDSVKFTHCAVAISDTMIVDVDFTTRLVNINDLLKSVKDYEIWSNYVLLTDDTNKISLKAISYLGDEYGFTKLVPHLLDALLGKICEQDIFFFRKLLKENRYVICSWVVSYAFAAINYTFDVDKQFATPDDIYDSIIKRPEWKKIKNET